MSPRVGLDDAAIDALADHAAQWTGFSRDAILPDAIRRAAVAVLREHPSWSAPELLLRASRSDPAVVHALCQGVSVGETYFFRHPEHFRTLAATVLPELLDAGVREIRAWSAGCATGEEAYSMAACLLDLLPWGRTATVLGTDLLERNLAAARAASYGLWSRRPSGPLLHPLYHPAQGDHVEIDDKVRAITRFEKHNLLEPMASGPFDVIFCRNVLVYFSPAAIRTATSHLAASLAPGGALFFGSMDVGEPPAGLVSAGLPELQIFRRPGLAPPEKKRPAVAPPAPAPLVPRIRPPEPVALHLRALVHIERGDKKVAEKALTDLTAQVPDYVPGILERALLHVRMGERTLATSLMREVLRRTEKLPPDEVVAGPEPLPASFYRDSARTFLSGGAA